MGLDKKAWFLTFMLILLF